jgi:hypothetical protein
MFKKIQSAIDSHLEADMRFVSNGVDEHLLD